MFAIGYCSEADPGFFQRRVVMRVQGKCPRAKGMGEGDLGVMFKYVDFLHFDFRCINLPNLRH